nr:MAG TPA: hypothetical protein [Caudoviricetes sp.]
MFLILSPVVMSPLLSIFTSVLYKNFPLRKQNLPKQKNIY